MTSTLSTAEKNWLLSLIKKELEPSPFKTEKTKTPQSQLQSLLKEIYERLRDTTTADEFDGFYARHLEDYKQKGRVFNILDEYCLKLGIKPELTDYTDARQVEKYLFTITEATLGEPATLEALKDLINAKYPDLVSDLPSIPSEQLYDQVSDFSRTLIEEISEKLDNGLYIDDSKLSEHLEKIKKSKGKIDDICRQLNQLIILGENTWEHIIYALISPFVPHFTMNGRRKRVNYHVLLCGDISTAKSEVLEIIEEIAPRQYRVDDSTKPSFEGVSTPDGIAAGIVDLANNGLILCHEFDKILKDFPTLRRYMDCKKMSIHKHGNAKHITVNITFVCGSNPKQDFFFTEIFRKQIPFNEGLLSRFDALLPMTITPYKNLRLLEQLAFFGGEIVDLSEIAEVLRTLVIGIESLTGVKISEEQQTLLKAVCQLHNVELSYRPLLIPRDFETLARLVNIIVCVNFYDREIADGLIYAKDEDVYRAISLWEDIIQKRKEVFLEKTEREILEIEDHILKAVAQHNPTNIQQLKEIIVDNLKLCCQATLYNKLNKLIAQGKIHKSGMRDGVLTPS